MTVWKFQLEVTDEQVVMMPKDATLLSVAIQGDVLVLWALVDETRPTEGRVIWIVGTGNPAKHVDGQPFIGTVQTHGGRLVWHVFEGRS